MPHRFNKLPPISLGPRPCGCFPGEVLCVCEAGWLPAPIVDGMDYQSVKY